VVPEERDWDCFLDKAGGILEFSFGAPLLKKEKSKNNPKRNPITTPGRKFSGFKLIASHGSSLFKMRICENERKWGKNGQVN
jgi:hypothetical protein